MGEIISDCQNKFDLRITEAEYKKHLKSEDLERVFVTHRHATPLASRAQKFAPLTRRRRFLVHVEREDKASSRLLFRHNRVFQPFAETKLKSCFGGNLNCLAGLRITPLTRFAF